MGSDCLRTASDALLAVDVQIDFCSGGALAAPNGEEVVAPINRLMDRFRHVVLTQDWHPPGHQSFASAHPGRRPYDEVMLDYGRQVLWPDHCVQGTPGATFHPRLNVNAADMILRKGGDPEVDSYSAFMENDGRTSTGLAGWLRERGVRRIFLAGLAFDFCVLWSAEHARRAGFETVVIEDACRGLDLANSCAQARRRLAAAGAVVTTVDELAATERWT